MYTKVSGVASYGVGELPIVRSEYKGSRQVYQATTPQEYSLTYPRIADSEGVNGVSACANTLDYLA